MSKKMLKRSLALGALMAFVITGSALAAETNTLGQGNYEVNSENTFVASGILWHENWESYPDKYPESTEIGRVWNLGDYTLWVNEQSGAPEHGEYAVVATPYEFIGSVNSKLIVLGEDGKTLVGSGLTTGGKIDVGTLLVDVSKFAIYSGGDTTIAANNIYLSAINGSTILTEGGSGADLTITPKEKLEIKNGNNDSEAAVSAGAGTTITIASATDTVDKADIMIDGNIWSVNDGAIDIKLETKNSYINGKISEYPNYGSTPNRKISLSNGATWNNNGASNVTLLTMKDGIINQESDNDIVIKEYTGSGTANFEANGKILIDKAASSAFLSLASKKDTPENIVTKLGVGEDAKDLKATIIRAAGAVTGDTTWAVDYEQTDKDNDGYFIAKLGEKSESVNPVNESIAEMHSIALMAWRAENNDMYKRLGELRDANGEHGAWARMTRGESEYESVKNQYNAYQLGYDQKAGDWTVGAAVTYTEGETSFAEGNGENDHTGLAVYGSKLNGDGSYLDLIAKYAKLDHEYTVSGGIGSGEYDTDGFALSAEYGKRFEQGNGLWIEPQVELTYGLVDSVGFAAENGRVSLDDMNSLVGRVGFRAGKDVKDGNVYVRASYLYDFEGETDIAFTDGVDTRSFKQDLGGGWWEFGIGTNINLSKATYIYADVEHACGGEVDTDWKWNLGVRYSF